MKILVVIILIVIVAINLMIQKKVLNLNDGRLFCYSKDFKYFTVGMENQTVDFLWMRFLQEIEVSNSGLISQKYQCLDQNFSWHYHAINLAMEIDPKFYELAANAPILISISINDSQGASRLFDKAVSNFPNSWKILFHSAYQALIEEKDHKKAADLLKRAGDNGAPLWVLSLAGGLYRQVGLQSFAETIYAELTEKYPDAEVTKRLRDKLDNKISNFYNKPTSQ